MALHTRGMSKGITGVVVPFSLLRYRAHSVKRKLASSLSPIIPPFPPSPRATLLSLSIPNSRPVRLRRACAAAAAAPVTPCSCRRAASTAPPPSVVGGGRFHSRSLGVLVSDGDSAEEPQLQCACRSPTAVYETTKLPHKGKKFRRCRWSQCYTWIWSDLLDDYVKAVIARRTALLEEKLKEANEQAERKIREMHAKIFTTQEDLVAACSSLVRSERNVSRLEAEMRNKQRCLLLNRVLLVALVSFLVVWICA